MENFKGKPSWASLGMQEWVAHWISSSALLPSGQNIHPTEFEDMVCGPQDNSPYERL